MKRLLHLLAGWQWSATQAPVVEIRHLIKALQLPTSRNMTTQPIIAHVQVLQIQRGQPRWKTPIDLIMVQIQRRQALRKSHLTQIKLEHVPRKVNDLNGLV